MVERLSNLKLRDGQRVVLAEIDCPEEPRGRIVDFVVTACVVCFDDDETIEMGLNDVVPEVSENRACVRGDQR